MTQFAFPYRIGAGRRTTGASREGHIRGLIEQVLFTRQGERVMRPDFGAGIHDLVFAENAPELAASTQHMVQAALLQWLSDKIELQEVVAQASGSKLSVTVRYRPFDEAGSKVVTVVREV